MVREPRDDLERKERPMHERTSLESLRLWNLLPLLTLGLLNCAMPSSQEGAPLDQASGRASALGLPPHGEPVPHRSGADLLQSINNYQQFTIRTRCRTGEEGEDVEWCDPSVEHCDCGLGAQWVVPEEDGGDGLGRAEVESECEVDPTGLDGDCLSNVIPYINQANWFNIEIFALAAQDLFNAAACEVRTLSDADPRFRFWDPLTTVLCTGSTIHQREANDLETALPVCPQSELSSEDLVGWINNRKSAGETVHTLVGYCLSDLDGYVGNVSENLNVGSCTYDQNGGPASVLQLSYASFYKEREELITVSCPRSGSTDAMEVEITFPSWLPPSLNTSVVRTEGVQDSSQGKEAHNWDTSVSRCPKGLTPYQIREDKDADGYGVVSADTLTASFCDTPHLYFSNQVATAPC